MEPSWKQELLRELRQAEPVPLAGHLKPSGDLFGRLFGTRSAPEEPRWAQEGHQELQITAKLHLQKPLKTIGFSRFLGVQGLPRQLLKTQEVSQEVILGLSGTS